MILNYKFYEFQIRSHLDDIRHNKVKHYKISQSHNKHLNIGHYLIDDRLKNGADKFEGEHIHFGTSLFPDWDSVIKYLIK